MLLFIGGCVPLRLAIALTAKNASPQTLQYMGLIALIPSFMFFSVWLTNSRMEKGVFDGPVWWNKNRLVHALILLLFAMSAISGNSDSWLLLAADTAFGLMSFLNHRLEN